MNRRRMLGILGAAALAAADTRHAGAAEPPVVRIGILQFGSVAWQLDIIRRHGLAEAEGVAIEPVILAANQATLVALQAGSVDVIVSDLLWVARQRASGADWSFRPYSTALGAVEVTAASPIRSLADLPGHRLGIAGTSLDKSWLLLRLLSRKEDGRDLDDIVEKSFGAPPLLAEQLAAGRLDAVLTYWQFAARLEARGARRLLGMGEAVRALGIAEPVPLVGYVLSTGWARQHAAACAAFFRACRRAEEILRRSDEEWQVIAPLTGAADAAELERLRAAYREGIPRGDETAMRAAAADLYDLLAGIGGETLVGPSRTLPPGTFLDGFGS
ncbi:MAG TPA: PhnD/SsuA/transferrin family substrate-binding protein [Stellaceae bacterium]|jgi:NitT/TauT family transport system substrate-binding protein|nr:PhnD/SsuA/transferrin family substrate-binding protein [Stellaceae bacterium]